MTVETRERGICLLCGKKRMKSSHHIIPVSDGGGGNPENITQCLCKECHDEVEEDPRKWARLLSRYHIRGGPVKVRERKVKGLPRAYSNKKTIMLSFSEASSPGGPLDGQGQLKFTWDLGSPRVTYKLLPFPPKRPRHLGEEGTTRRYGYGRGRSRMPRGLEGTPNRLAEELGVAGRIVRAILRAKYPRSPKLMGSDWGVLTPEQEYTVRELVPLLDNTKLANLLSK